MEPHPECLFCRIVSGEVPAEIVRESELSVAFRDIDPQAPTHVLVIPRRHVTDLVALADASSDEVADVFRLAGEVAVSEDVAENGYRLVANTGADANQVVFHAHLHVMGGRAMTWPPG